MKIHQIEDMSDPSDTEKLKRSRNERWKKVSTDFITEYPTSKKYKKDIPLLVLIKVILIMMMLLKAIL